MADTFIDPFPDTSPSKEGSKDTFVDPYPEQKPEKKSIYEAAKSEIPGLLESAKQSGYGAAIGAGVGTLASPFVGPEAIPILSAAGGMLAPPIATAIKSGREGLESMGRGIEQTFAHPIESFQQSPISTSLQWLLPLTGRMNRAEEGGFRPSGTEPPPPKPQAPPKPPPKQPYYPSDLNPFMKATPDKQAEWLRQVHREMFPEENWPINADPFMKGTVAEQHNLRQQTNPEAFVEDRKIGLTPSKFEMPEALDPKLAEMNKAVSESLSTAQRGIKPASKVAEAVSGDDFAPKSGFREVSPEETQAHIDKVNQIHENPSLTPQQKSEQIDRANGEHQALRILDNERGSADLGKIGNMISGILSPESQVKGGEKWAMTRQKALGFTQRADEFILKVMEPLKKFSPEIRTDVFQYMEGDKSLEELPFSVQNISKNIRRAHDSLGQTLVNVGMLDKDVYEANKGKYIRYLYLKHLLPEDVFKAAGGGAGRLNMTYLRERSKTMSKEVRRGLGLIEDAYISGTIGLRQILRDVNLNKYYQALSSKEDWFHPNGMVEVPRIEGVRSEKWTVGQLEDEIKAYKGMVKAHPENLPIKERLDQLQTAYQSIGDKTIPEGFHKVPNDLRYGPIRGGYIAKPIWQDIESVWSVGQKQMPDWIRGMSKYYLMSQQAFKMAKVPLNIPTMVHNILSNPWQAGLEGVPLHRMPDLITSGVADMFNSTVRGKPSAEFVQAKREGLFKANWNIGDLESINKELWKMKGSNNFMGLLQTLSGLTKYYGKIDDVFKFAWFKYYKGEGMETSQAARMAHKIGYDYSMAHPAVKGARKWGFMPFVTYQVKVADAVNRAIQKAFLEGSPKGMAVILAGTMIPYAMTAASKSLLNITEEEYKKLMSLAPEFIKKSESFMMMPWRNEKGQVVWMDTQYLVPWGNFQQMSGSMAKGDPKEAFKQLGVGNPLTSLLTVVNTGVDPFTDRKVWDDLDPASIKTQKFMMYLGSQWLPSMLSPTGPISKAIQQQTKPEGSPDITTPSETISKTLGFPTYAIDPAKGAKQNKAIKNELQMELRRKMKDPYMSPSDKEKYIKEYLGRVQGLTQP